ncbi:MAG: hypothetical protein AVDCRST_MAG57-698, partial [uncultured Blastococcus sp.]
DDAPLPQPRSGRRAGLPARAAPGLRPRHADPTQRVVPQPPAGAL